MIPSVIYTKYTILLAPKQPNKTYPKFKLIIN
jgi:hypothetical protein